MKERRIGTFSLGIVLLVYGVLFLISTYVKSFSLYFVFRLWPFIFIVLGGEILYSAVRYREENYRYDFAANQKNCSKIITVIVLPVAHCGIQDFSSKHNKYKRP